MTIDEMERVEEQKIEELKATIHSQSNDELVSRLLVIQGILDSVDDDIIDDHVGLSQTILLQRITRNEILQRMGMGGDADGGNE